MPNGGSDCCAFCWFQIGNSHRHGSGAVGRPTATYCSIRGFEIGRPGLTCCVSHRHHDPLKIEVPIGPVCETSGTNDPRDISMRSPDTEEVRTTLLEFVGQTEAPSRFWYPSGMYFEDVVIWQLGGFLEARALDELWRIASFDMALLARDTGAARKGKIAEDSLLKILCSEAPDPIGQVWYWPT
jgi:hypothetical protein